MAEEYGKDKQDNNTGIDKDTISNVENEINQQERQEIDNKVAEKTQNLAEEQKKEVQSVKSEFEQQLEKVKTDYQNQIQERDKKIDELKNDFEQQIEQITKRKSQPVNDAQPQANHQPQKDPKDWYWNDLSEQQRDEVDKAYLNKKFGLGL